MNLEKWVDGYKVHVMDWIDGENIYINIQYFKPGSSLSKPPAMEKQHILQTMIREKTWCKTF